ncbi:adenylosuccinate synthetase [Methylocystis bryophila]|uniref:Adenylosuccinate synthetase n=1 Tax=Methylocystis bryophila TaxID=655015 RepID=A0A1W6MZ41_9HYPH|nr:adenylosuccinate synthetase [Methylocystis bryophila]ARN82809.1 hypothetical protein B1812_18850 [Methylocystis bryophila]BDV39058.1 adenylosuccinate synthetase [Methylocystis bryophila]
MPVSVVVGGQFGSEGKGKVALYIAERTRAAAVVRVGGTNSGHTAAGRDGVTRALRQLPVSVLAPNAVAVLPAGAIIDPKIFFQEVKELGLGPDRVYVSPYATLITESDKCIESESGLVERVGSTGSGTGAALIRRMRRCSNDEPVLASQHPELAAFVKDTDAYFEHLLSTGERIVIEGSQGFGLSLLHGGFYPYATSRDTTAGAFVSEAGLSPRDVDDITLVMRAFPIRVAGNSGPLFGETSWAALAAKAGLPADFQEFTTSTRRVRRVGRFDANVVLCAIRANKPNRIVLNHFDYFNAAIRQGLFDEESRNLLVEKIERPICRQVDWIGTAPASLLDRIEAFPKNQAARSSKKYM